MSRRTRAVIREYEQATGDPLLAEYYGHSGFYNFGCWQADTRDQAEACGNLVERLLALIPVKSGTILDVACGMGGTARHLLKHYAPAAVVGVDATRTQLRTSMRSAPGCAFLAMDATRLAFRDRTFDNVICVEAAFHFDTRERFMREAARVLKPGGRLVLSDIVIRGWAARLNPALSPRNYVKDPAAYRSLCAAAGLADAEIIDATDECWREFSRRSRRWMGERRAEGRIGRLAYGRLLLRYLALGVAIRRYLLVSATKP